MIKEEKSLYIFVAIAGLIIGFLIGYMITDFIICKSGISQTSYCKEIQVDTIQYDYQQDMYKFEIKLIK
jgi:Na+/glutamate symporter